MEGHTEQAARGRFEDRGSLRQFQEVERLDDDDKVVIKKLLDAFLMKKRVQELAAHEAEVAVNDLYRGADPRLMPTYTIAEAARYLYVSVSTLRSWVVGRPYSTSSGDRYFQPIIPPPDSKRPLLSFTNLVEAHVLAAIRRHHKVTLPNVRSAVDHLRTKYGVDHPLADVRFKTDGVSLFIDQLGQPDERLAAGPDGDPRGHGGSPPAGRARREGPGLQAVPVHATRRAHGRPAANGGHRLQNRLWQAGAGRYRNPDRSVLADRYKAGESMQELAEDYECALI